MNRDLDAEIAEKVFEWKLIPVGKDYDGKNECNILFPPGKKPDQDYYNTLPRTGLIHKGFGTPHYTSDLVTAIGFCKHIGYDIKITQMPTDAEELTRDAFAWWKVCVGDT